MDRLDKALLSLLIVAIVASSTYVIAIIFGLFGFRPNAAALLTGTIIVSSLYLIYIAHRHR